MKAHHFDDLGILREAAGDEPWHDVPQAVAQTALDARSADDVLTAMLDSPRPWSVPLQRELMHPSSGAIATLIPADCRTALDLGTGWLGLAPALGSLGVQVTRADWIYSRLRFARLMHPAPGGTDVHIDIAQLPPPDVAQFDVAFLDLDALARRLDAVTLTSLLASVRARVEPSGVIVVAATNRRAALLRERKPVKALQTTSLAARFALAGLHVLETRVPLPTRADWRVLVPRPRLRAHLREHDERSGLKRTVGRLLLSAGGERLLAAESFLVLASSASAAPQTLIRHVAGGREDTDPVALALSDARVALLGSEHFAKVALSEDQRHALRAEADKTRRARSTAFAPVVLDPGEVRDHGGILSITYPAVVGRRVSTEIARDVMSGALGQLDASQLAPLSDTTLWSRLSSPRGQRDLHEIGAQVLWQWLEDECRDSTVPIGPTHGDLHPDNVLVPVSGPALLVDWNRFEERNPLLLDPLYAAVNLERVTTGCSLAEAFQRAAANRLTGPLAHRAEHVRGELDPLQSAVLLLLDRLASYSLPRRRFKPWTLPPLREAVVALVATVAKRT